MPVATTAPYKKKILAVASKGGHWVQLMRITKALEKRYDIIYASTNKQNAAMVGADKFTYLEDYTRRTPQKMLSVISTSLALIKKEKPDIIITTGAAPAICVILVARLHGVKSIWIDSIANVEHLSLSGRIAKRLASKVYTQWAHLADNKKLHYAGSIL